MVWLVTVAPTATAGKDVLDALVGGQFSGLSDPGAGQSASVHILQFAIFSALEAQGGEV
jgi:hypothetical protein